MKRLALAAIALGMTTLAVAPADGFWLDAFYCHLERGREGNNLWPHQHLETDRRNASAPFDVMVRNGWRRQNLLGSHHFTEDGAQLTEAGKLRVQWILTQPPVEHRQVFIERSLNEEVNVARIAAANEFATIAVRDGVPTDAQGTHILSDGRPATTVDFVNTQFRENMMTPALKSSGYNMESP